MLPIGMGLLYFSLLAFGMLRREHGLPVALQVRRECERLNEQIHSFRQENTTLKNELGRLQNDSRYLEKIARQELNMLGEHEMVFIFPD
jgi:cell division protein FtsB